MSDVTILFESVEAAKEAFTTLKPMIDVSLDCNALTYDEIDGNQRKAGQKSQIETGLSSSYLERKK